MATTIAAQVIRHEAGSGSTLVSSGFPFPPGLVTEQQITNGTIRVRVNDVEVAAFVTALRGRHYDGSVRSVLIQFTYNLMEGIPVSAQVIVGGGTRTVTDPAYVRPTLAHVQNCNVILPTSPQYLCSTFISFRGLIPMGQGTTVEERLYTALAEDRFDSLAVTQYDTNATYDDASAMISLWARSGDAKYFKEANKRVGQDWLPYATPLANQTPACRVDSVINPDGRPGTNACGLPAEQVAARVLSYASMYLLTGYRDYWGILAYFAQWNHHDKTSQTVMNDKMYHWSNWDQPRSNWANEYGLLLAAYMVDATFPVNGQYFTGRTFDWKNQFNWIVNAMVYHQWDLKWVPFSGGSGTIPLVVNSNGTINTVTISQSNVTAQLLGVYTTKWEPNARTSGTTMPAAGYLQVKNIQGGSFTNGEITISGATATATGSEESDYRQGLVGTRSYSVRTFVSIPVGMPIFQQIFPINFLIDYYLYVERDSRIPAIVKASLDSILLNIRLMAPGDTYYGYTNGTWGNPLYGKPYIYINPIPTTPAEYDARPYDLPEYTRMISFVLKTLGEDTVKNITYSQWYNIIADTANIGGTLGGWQWKHFGQMYAWCQDAPWMMAQSTLLDYGPAVMRTPTQWNAIPGDTPDLQREYSGGDIAVPVVTSFSVPASTTELTVPITSFAGADDVGVTGYLVTESASSPGVSDPGWSATPQTSYTFLTYGDKTLYAWVKDAVGNVSDGYSASIAVTMPLGPAVTSFSIQSPAQSLTVNVAAFTASGGMTITGYLITESSVVPAASDPRWLSSPPATFTCSRGGNRTLYAWAKDTLDRVSASRTTTVDIARNAILGGGGVANLGGGAGRIRFAAL